MSLGQEQAREGIAPTVQTPHCSTAPHTRAWHSQGQDEERSSFWGINRLECGLTVKAAVGKFFNMLRELCEVERGFSCPKEVSKIISSESDVNLVRVDEEWWEPYTSSMLRFFINLIFFYSHSYPHSLQKWLELKYNVSYLDLSPVLLYRNLNLHLQNKLQIYI